MNENQCKDGSKTGFWSATKGIFKAVGCGINTVASAAEAAAVSMNNIAQDGYDKSCLCLVESMQITHSDGSSIENVNIARLLSNAFSEDDFQKISAIAEVYDLDTSQFFLMQRRSAEIQKLLNKFEK